MLKKEQYCVMCEEGIFNPICPACLTAELKSFFLEQNFKFKKDVLEEAELLHTILEGKEVKLRCAICKKESSLAACPFCFIKELYYFVLERNPALAKKLKVFFNFDFGPTEVGSTRKYWIRDF